MNLQSPNDDSLFYSHAPDPDLMAMIRDDEGFRPKMYTDTLGRYTIGIGFCLDRIEMPLMVAEYWCNMILREREIQLCRTPLHPVYINLNAPRQFAILNMCYQLGVYGVSRFSKMWAALDNESYKEAGAEALDSIWARIQTPERAQRIANVLETGKLTAYGIERNEH